MGGCFISPAFKCAVTDEIVPSGGQNKKNKKEEVINKSQELYHCRLNCLRGAIITVKLR